MSYDLEGVFSFGVRVAEHVHGARQDSDAILDALEEIAAGELTIIGTPEETAAEVPPGMPESLRRRLPEMLNESRARDRRMARAILDEIDRTFEEHERGK